MSEPEIAVVGTKGQIVIPQALREVLKIRPKSKLAIYRKGDKLVVSKLTFPSLDRKLESLFRDVDSQYKEKKKPTEKEILKEIQRYRAEKRTMQGR